MKCSDTQIRLSPFTEETLIRENRRYVDTGGVSKNNRSQGFIPAFLDTETGNVYRSRFQDGSAAPVHVLSGLPRELFDPDGSPSGQLAVKQSLISGFLREETFYSREEAAQAAASGPLH